MAGSFTLRWNASKNRIEETLVGQWDADTMRRFEVEIREIIDAIQSPKWTVLVDVRNSAPQSNENQKKIEKITELYVAKGCVKFVVLASKAVVTMQVKRLSALAGAGQLVAYASTEAEAEQLLSAVPV